jgi:hypothetical protein
MKQHYKHFDSKFKFDFDDLFNDNIFDNFLGDQHGETDGDDSNLGESFFQEFSESKYFKIQFIFI